MTNEVLGRPLVPASSEAPPEAALARTTEWLALPVAVLLLVTVWKAAALRMGTSYLLPDPYSVLASLLDHRSLILWHASATVAEVVLGFAAGFLVAALLGYAISHSRSLERFLTPYVVASQAIPIVAVAPLLVLWFSPGMPVKVTAAALVVFFPMLVSTVVAFRNISETDRELMHVMAATRMQMLRKLEIPAALPYLLGGIRTGITLAVIGAVVGEFLGSNRGLGTLVQISDGVYNGALMFAAVVSLVVLALTLYGGAATLERVLLRDR
jgi:NitT/TauT family transport system permease protein